MAAPVTSREVDDASISTRALAGRLRVDARHTEPGPALAKAYSEACATLTAASHSLWRLRNFMEHEQGGGI